MHRPARALVLSLVVLSTSACFLSDVSLNIRGVKAVDPPGCMVDQAAPTMSSGMLDVAFGGSYIVNAELEVLANKPMVTLTGAEVRLAFEDGTAITSEGLVVPLTRIVDSGDVVPLKFTAIPAGYLTVADAGRRVMVEFRITAGTDDGAQHEGPWFTFPVDTCNQCLVDFPEEAWSDECGGYDCCLPGPDLSERPCNIGQDDLVDCRLCAASFAMCWDPSCECS